MGQKVNKITALVFKAVALAMSVVAVILNILGEATVDTSITLLGIGLLGITLGSLMGVKYPD